MGTSYYDWATDDVITATRLNAPYDASGNVKLLSGGSIVDQNSNEIIRVASTVASAVNEITVANAATGNKPIISQTGADDVGLTIEGVDIKNGVVTGSLTGNVTGNCTGSSGSCTGNSATATTSTTFGPDVIHEKIFTGTLESGGRVVSITHGLGSGICGCIVACQGPSGNWYQPGSNIEITVAWDTTVLGLGSNSVVYGWAYKVIVFYQ